MYWQFMKRFTNNASNLKQEDRPNVNKVAKIAGCNVGGVACISTQSAMGEGGEIMRLGTSHKVSQGASTPGFSTCGVAQEIIGAA